MLMFLSQKHLVSFRSSQVDSEDCQMGRTAYQWVHKPSGLCLHDQTPSSCSWLDSFKIDKQTKSQHVSHSLYFISRSTRSHPCLSAVLHSWDVDLYRPANITVLPTSDILECDQLWFSEWCLHLWICDFFFFSVNHTFFLLRIMSDPQPPCWVVTFSVWQHFAVILQLCRRSKLVIFFSFFSVVVSRAEVLAKTLNHSSWNPKIILSLPYPCEFIIIMEFGSVFILYK